MAGRPGKFDIGIHLILQIDEPDLIPGQQYVLCHALAEIDHVVEHLLGQRRHLVTITDQ